MGLTAALSLQFFMFILIIFLVELSAAILAFIFREHVCTTQLPILLHWGGALSDPCLLKDTLRTICLIQGLEPKHDLHLRDALGSRETQPSGVSSYRGNSRRPRPGVPKGPHSWNTWYRLQPGSRISIQPQ